MDALFEYLDYRKYLRDFYEEKKSKSALFSLRYISQKAGVDPSFLVKVMQGQLHLSDKAIPRFIRFLKLDARQAEYFELLVRFNKAKHPRDLKGHFEQLLALRDPGAKGIASGRYEFFNHWYCIAIRELLNFHPFQGDFRALGRKLDPPISAAEAKRAVELLERLDFVRKRPDGGYDLTDRFLTTGESWESVAIANFQRQAMRLGEEALDRIPKGERDISTVTVSLSKAGFAAMRERLKAIRRELLEMARQDEGVDGVYQVNFQVFPLTRRGSGGEA